MAKKNCKKKVIKDPKAPKKPTCAYFFFQIVRRNQLKEEYPNLTNTEVVIQLGKDWNSLTDLHKLPFEKLSEADKYRYDTEMEKYRLEFPELIEADKEEEAKPQEPLVKKRSSKKNKKSANKGKKTINRKKDNGSKVPNNIDAADGNEQGNTSTLKKAVETKKKRSKPSGEATKKKSRAKTKPKDPEQIDLVHNNNETDLALKEVVEII